MGSVVTSFISDLKDRFTPYTEWLGDLKNPKILKADLLAGLTVALVLIPQSMAYAQLAGLPPYVGLYASFLPAIIAAIFGSSRQLATGPVAVVSLMTAATLEPLAASNTEGFLVYAAVLALMVGIFQLSLGALRLGVLVDFLSHPVVVGFTNAAAIIIASSQLSKLFGVDSRKGEHHYETMWNLIQDIPQTHLATLAMGMLALLLLIYTKKLVPKFPSVLVTVVITTLLAWGLNFDSLGGAVVGVVPEGLPSFSVPSFSFLDVKNLIVASMIIALLGFVEAISVAKAIASETRQRLSANQELVGQGLGNIASGLFGGYPVSGSFSRSAVNFAADARTGFASIVTGILVAVTLLFLTPLLYHLPQATLAAVIVMAVVNLVKIKPIIHAWKVHRHDGVVAVVVFIVTLVFAPHLEKGIMIGVLLSLGLFLYRTMSPKFVEVARHKDGTLRDAQRWGLKTSDTLSIYRFDGALYFANSGYLEGKILNSIAAKPSVKVVILDLEAVDEIDATGEETLGQIAERFESAGIEFYIARAKVNVFNALTRSGLVAKIGEEHFFRERTEASRYAKEKLGDAIDIEPILKPMRI
ncbi:MAG: sodium-independent anion transporter [Aquificaceae bacterium]|nr:MAG: sodium-independent anion transporter [Aquificaceae bacterium]